MIETLAFLAARAPAIVLGGYAAVRAAMILRDEARRSEMTRHERLSVVAQLLIGLCAIAAFLLPVASGYVDWLSGANHPALASISIHLLIGAIILLMIGESRSARLLPALAAIYLVGFAGAVLGG